MRNDQSHLSAGDGASTNPCPEVDGAPTRRCPAHALQVPENEIVGGQMADDLKETGRQDDARINLDQNHEVQYWSEKFGVSRDQAAQRSGEGWPDGEKT